MSTVFSYRVEYEVDTDTGAVTATIPELSNVSSFGATFAEAEANVREAALGYLEVLARDRKDIPEPAFRTDGTYLQVTVPQTS